MIFKTNLFALSALNCMCGLFILGEDGQWKAEKKAGIRRNRNFTNSALLPAGIQKKSVNISVLEELSTDFGFFSLCFELNRSFCTVSKAY